MSRFMYKVRDGHGALSTGVVKAATLEEASLLLRGEGKFVIQLDAVNEADLDQPSQSLASSRGRVRRHEVITFAHQMAVMIDTGVPISEALQCVADQAKSPAFKAVLTDVADQVAAGTEFSAALRRYPEVFPTVMTSLIRASEVSGTMGPMLERVSCYLQKEHATMKKVRGALIYPSVMLLMVLAVTVFLMLFVLPRFTDIYASRGAALPTPTLVLMGISEAMTTYAYHWLGGAAVLLAAAVFAGRTPSGRRFLDTLKLKAPIVGPLFRKLYITRGCRTMGTMINAGVPVLDMVAIVRHVTANTHYQSMWADVDGRLRQGSQLSDVLLASPHLIPRSVAQMIHSGEKSGRLGPVMEKIAEYTEEEFDDQVRTATQFIEPALVATMGLIIGFVAIALLLPIFSISKVAAGS
jgi:type IV pilus assembly protein PilC